MRTIICDICGCKIWDYSAHWNHYRYEDFNKDFCPVCAYELIRASYELQKKENSL